MLGQDKDFLQQCLSQAISDVFSTMAGVEPSERQETQGEKPVSKGKITGAMMVLGERNALLTMTMSQEDAAMIVAVMTGVVPENITNEESYDGVAELVNMIAGRAKALLVGTSYHYRITPPITIVGDQHFIVFKKQAPRVTMYFNADATNIDLELTYL